MKKHIKLEWVYIAVLVISLILSIVTGVQIAVDRDRYGR